uniref:Uncharacterized protein n=1 Tax=Panagrolaimus sp. JU765 TaxID=591449 RepID=A0AC34RJF6_9BILA
MASDSKSSKNKYIDINRCVDVDELAKIFGTKVKVEPAAEKREKIEEKATSSRPSIVFKYSKKEVGEDEVYIEREGKTPKNVGKEAKSAEIREPDTLDENGEKMEIDMRKLPNPFDDPEWNQAAYLRFFQIIVEHAIPYERSAYSIYNHYVAEKMRYIESTEDENVLILIVDEADHHKIGKTPAIFLKPAYEIRPTPEEVCFCCLF